jgi:hypothetical protein
MSRNIVTIIFIFLAIAPAECLSESLKFKCQGVGEGIIWKYAFEIDKETSKGIEKGVTLDGYPYTKNIEVVFTPERMQIGALGEKEFAGWIDRTDLSFCYGWANGSCDIIPVGKKDAKF